MALSAEDLNKLKAHAEAHYDEGWDVVVETYTDSELAEATEDCSTLEEAIAWMEDLVDIWDDQRAEAQYQIRMGS